MIKKIKHLGRLLGLAFYILLAAVGCMITAYANFIAFYDFVFHVRVSIATVAAAVVGIIVCVTLYSVHADHIRKNLAYLRPHNVSKSMIAYKIFYLSAGALTILNLGIIIGASNKSSIELSEKIEITSSSKTAVEPKSTQKPLESSGSVADVPTEALGTPSSNRTQKIVGPTVPIESSRPEAAPLPHRQAFCKLNEVFSVQDLESCLTDIRKNPPQKGIGGPGYDLRKDKDKWRIQGR